MQLWYVCIAKQNQDAAASRELRKLGYEILMPRVYVRSPIVGGGMKPVAALRLSPYIFVKFDVSQGEAGPVKNARGVGKLICDPSGAPMPLHDGEAVILALQQMEDEEFSNADRAFKRGRTDLKIGQAVRIVSGKKAWIGIEGTLASLQRGKAKVFAGDMVRVIDLDDENIVAAADFGKKHVA